MTVFLAVESRRGIREIFSQRKAPKLTGEAVGLFDTALYWSSEGMEQPQKDEI